MSDYRIVSAVALALTAHLALLPQRYPRAGVALAVVLAVAPLLFTIFARPPARLRTLRAPLATLLATLPLALWASPLPWILSWPRATLLLWSIGLALLVASWRPMTVFGRVVDRSAWLWLYLGLGTVWAFAPLPAFDAASAFGPAAMAQNELAGTLVLFVPVGLALLAHAARDPDASWRRRLALALVSAPPAAALIAGGSRGGIVAFAAALAVMASLATRGRGRLLVAGATLIAAALLLLPSPARDFLLYDGSPQGFSWNLALSGRPEIWQRALHILGDAPLTGIGPGTFGPVVAALYPVAFASDRPLEDAHDLYLQTALDLGPAGLAALIALLALALARAVRDAREADPAPDEDRDGDLRRLVAARVGDDSRQAVERATAIGLAGALAGHLVYSIGDAVALGTPGSVGLWLLLGLIFAAPSSEPERARPPLRLVKTGDPIGDPSSGSGGKASRADSAAGVETAPAWRDPRRVWPAATLILVVLLLLPSVRARARLNLIALDVMSAVLAEPERLGAVRDDLYALEPRPCRASWLLGQVLRRQNDARAGASFEDFLRCAPAAIDLIAIVEPDNRALASAAVRRHPHAAAAHRYHARSFGPSPTGADRAAAVASYRRALALDPRDGRAWYQLANLLATTDLPAARDAYLAACRNGDPGANGCIRAAETALRLGDRNAAIRYLRLSRWPEAHRRADALERNSP